MGFEKVPNLFISYRREDSGPEAGRIADRMRAIYGRHSVFHDVGSLSAGERFDCALTAAIERANVVLVVMGKHWLAELLARGDSGSDDYHRKEVAEALRLRKRVLPVLVGGAAMPDPKVMPSDLRGLAQRHAIHLHYESWDAGIARLISALARPRRWRAVVLRMVAACICAPVLVWMAAKLRDPDWVTFDMARALTLGLVALYGVVELIAWRRHAARPHE